MKYKLITDNEYENIIDKILKNRNITNLEEIKYPSAKNILDRYTLDNIELAVEKLMEAVAERKEIGIIWDCDCDGYCSGALINNYLSIRFKNQDIKLKNYIHEGKQHGLTDDIKLDDNLSLLIVVDGGSNDYDQHKKLKEKGIDIIILDHHEAEKVSENAIVVNNQLCNYDNKELSGVGICYKFCKVIDDYVGDVPEEGGTLADYFLDLVSLGNIADMVSMLNLETRFYATIGMHNINNRMIKALINKQAFTLNGKMNFEKVGFCIAPLINGIIRQGTQKDKELVMEAFMDIEREVPYKKRGSNAVVQVDIADECARLMVNAKNRQDTKVKKALEIVEDKIIKNKLYKDKVMMIDVTEVLDNNLTGLVANKLLGKYKRPILLMQKRKEKDKEEFGGSARGYNVEDFKKVCTDSGLFTLAEGHAGAFGIGFDIEKEDEIRAYFNNYFKDTEFDTGYLIDLEIQGKDIDTRDIISIGELEDIWNRDLKEPLFLIKNLHIKDSDIKMTDSKNKKIYFRYKNISFNKRTNNETILDEMRCKDTSKPHFGDKNLELNIVGRFKIENSKGKEYPSVEIVDFESKEYEELIF